MDFDYSPAVVQWQARLNAFFDEFVYPNEQRYYQEVAAGDRWQPTELVEELKSAARSAGAAAFVVLGFAAFAFVVAFALGGAPAVEAGSPPSSCQSLLRPPGR